MEIGLSAMRLGAGRAKMDDVIDMAAGIVLCKKVGDKVNIGDILCYCHTNKEGVEEVYQDVVGAFELSEAAIKVPPIVHEYIH